MRSVLVLLWSLLVGCGPKTDPEPLVAAAAFVAERFRLTVEGQFSTTAEGVVLPPEAADLLRETQLSLELVIRKEFARPFRDGSLGYRVVFESADGQLHAAGEEVRPVPLELAGRSVELRTFPDGELLDVSLMEHVVGFGRYGDVFDLIFPVLTPSPPPDLRRAEAEGAGGVGRAMHWPVRLSRQQGMRNTLWAQWTLVSQDREAQQLRYSGSWEVQGANIVGAGPEGQRLPVTALGAGSGTVRLTPEGQVLAHQFDWWREVTLAYPGDREVVQVQRFAGTLERLP